MWRKLHKLRFKLARRAAVGWCGWCGQNRQSYALAVFFFFSKLPTHSTVQQFKPDVAYICVFVCVYFKMSPSYGLRG